MGNSISNIINITNQDQIKIKLDELKKNETIDYIQSIKTKKLVINKNFANRLKHVELENTKLISMCLELYEKIEKELPEFVTSHKKFKTDRVEFAPIDVLDIVPTFVNTKENYETLQNLTQIPDNVNSFTTEQLGLIEFNNTFKALTTSSDMLGLSKKIIFHLSDYIKLRYINSFNESIDNSTNLEFNFGKATYIYKKKGDKKVISNYRRIISIPVIVNLFHRMLMIQCDAHLRNNNLVDMTIQKAGITGQKAPILQQIIKIKEIIKDINTCKGKAALMFLDIKDAFGSLDREALFIILEKYKFDNKFIDYMRNYYDSFTYCTTIEETRINNVSWTNGLIQGCSLSPLLFVTALNYVLKHFHDTNTNTVGYNFRGEYISLCAYMDDIVLICKDVDSLEFSYKKIIDLLGLLGMKLNTQKTIIILPGFSNEEKKAVNIDNIQVVDKFIYLGCTINSDSAIEEIFTENYNKILEWLMNLDIKKPNNQQKITEFTEYVQPEIARRVTKMYDLPVSNKIKLVTLIRSYLDKWGYADEIQIFPTLDKTFAKNTDTILKKIDLEAYDKLNAEVSPDSELFDITSYRYNGVVDFKYGENNEEQELMMN